MKNKFKSEREIDIYSKGFNDGITWFRKNADFKAILNSQSNKKRSDTNGKVN